MMTSFTPGRPHWWQWLTVLSLDAPPVAMVWQELFAQVLGVDLAWYQPVLLGLAVWVIYGADRWIEGWRLSPEMVQTQRHYFYIAWRWPVFSAGLFIMLVAFIIALGHLPRREWIGGGFLVVLALIYLLSHQLLHRHQLWRLPKELCVAVLFALGTALAPVVLVWPVSMDFGLTQLEIVMRPYASLWLPLGLFGLLCLTDLVLIASWETEVDLRHGQTSLALRFFRRHRYFIHVLPWLVSGLSFMAAFHTSERGRAAAFDAAVSAMLLGMLDQLEPRIGRQAARALVDLTLLTPAAAWIF